jgi:hypothetical protein
VIAAAPHLAVRFGEHDAAPSLFIRLDLLQTGTLQARNKNKA